MTEKDFTVFFEQGVTGIDRTPAAYVVLDSRGEAEEGLEEFARLLGHPQPENQHNLIQCLPSSGIQLAFSSCVNEKKSAFCTLLPTDPEDKKNWYRLYMVPKSGADGKVEKVIVIAVNITDFKSREQELTEQNRQMAEIARQVEKTNALLEIQKGEISQQKRTIEAEKEKSDMLLMNILPHEVARQLKSKGTAGTREYKQVTVLFTDFKSFSQISKELTPNELVSTLDAYFAKFDEITVAHYLEKIKTIGDSYMCAGGLPLSNRSNPIDAVLAGLEIQHCVNVLNAAKKLDNKTEWELRIGIHTGPVIAGVIGKKRFAYDVWGDTVNIASRMEQSGQAGMVNISGTTYEFIREYFDCDYRGKVETKNMGKIDMYYVNRIKPEFSLDESGILPNNRMNSLVNKL